MQVARGAARSYLKGVGRGRGRAGKPGGAMEPIDLLRHEHRVIDKVLAATDAAIVRMGVGGDVSPRFFRDVVEFAREFADGCHHAKEEQVLFKRLGERGLSQEVASLSEEHAEIRHLTRRLGEAVARWEAGDPEAPERARRAARHYVDLLREHIREEDQIVFPTVERTFSEAEREEIAQAFEALEAAHGGQEVHARYAWLAESLAVEVRATA